MTVQDALDIIRERTNDAQSRIYTNAELIQYVNLACVAVVNQMIAAGNPITVKSLSVPVTTGVTIPADFHSLCPGEPCRIDGGKVYLDESFSTGRSARYFASPSKVSVVSDVVPLPESYAASVVNAAVELALMRIDRSVEQERAGHQMAANIRPQRQDSVVRPPAATEGGAGNVA